MNPFIHLDTVPEEGRIFWTGTAASIPSGWARDTQFDGRMIYCDGAAYTGVVTFGGAHSHDLDDGSTLGHRHTMGSHTHTLSAGASTGHAVATTGTGVVTLGLWIVLGHSHGSSTSGAASYSTSYTTVTTSSDVARPVSTTVIVLKPDGADKLLQPIPVGAVIPCDSSSSLPFDFAYEAGLTGTYVCAATTGADGGASTGTATHTHTGTSHTHTCAHTHAGATCGSSLTINNMFGGAGAPSVAVAQHHTVTLTTGGGSVTTDSATITLSTETNAVRATQLYPVAAGFARCPAHPNGVMIAYTGSVSALPAEWALCDGSNGTVDTRFNYIVWATTGIGSENGEGITHTHTVTAHAHTVTSGAHSDHGTSIRAAGGKTGSLGGNNVQQHAGTDAHTHTWTVGSANVGNAASNSSITADSVSKESAGASVVLIKLTPKPVTLGVYHGTGKRLMVA